MIDREKELLCLEQRYESGLASLQHYTEEKIDILKRGENMADKRNQNAKYQIKDGQLVISIGLAGLKRSIEVDTDLIVDDEVKAAFEIKRALSFEEENGRTPFSIMLADAAYSAYEGGGEGLSEAKG